MSTYNIILAILAGANIFLCTDGIVGKRYGAATFNGLVAFFLIVLLVC